MSSSSLGKPSRSATRVEKQSGQKSWNGSGSRVTTCFLQFGQVKRGRLEAQVQMRRVLVGPGVVNAGFVDENTMFPELVRLPLQSHIFVTF